ncbi:MAG: nucleotide sugar dehydrogenase [Ignavibacteriales bacterium]|nr:nucleotide sugar dehydrogenase [Ignavibacteriales bacterium]
MEQKPDYKNELIKRIDTKTAVIGIIGLGYVGLPLALTFAEKDFNVIGFDIDEKKIPVLNSGRSYIKHISEDRIEKTVTSKKFKAVNNFSQLVSCDCIIVCVPTPLDEHREPDISYIKNSGKEIANFLRAGQLIVLESSTYPGTTEEILLPLFESSKLEVGKDFFLAFSPEREDPGNESYNTSNIPKIVGGVTPNCLETASKLYDSIVVQVVQVSSPRVAEAAKLLENIYRSVNIALVNELKMVFSRMNIDIWEVIEAAKTKPFGYQPFYPGPGLGGHCIPIDPFYLTWKAREYDINTKFIELAGEVNTYQPYYVVEKAIEALNKFNVPITQSKILILGVSYKKNIDDMRESPALKLIELFQEKAARVDYSDPFFPKLPPTRKYKFNLHSVQLNYESIQSYDLLLLVTDHDDFDYALLARSAKFIVDTRNAFNSRKISGNNILKI